MVKTARDADATRNDQREIFTLMASLAAPNPDAGVRPLWPPHERLLAMAKLQSGQRVLDLACGRAGPTFAIAERVGPEGFVVGLDITPVMIDDARSSADRRAIRNVEFRLIDSEVDLGVPDASCSVATCLFGLMYMPEPVGALRELHRVLKPGGRVALNTWAALERCPFFAVPSQIIQRYLGHPPLDPLGPGTFALGSQEILAEDLTAAGFTDVETDMTEVTFEADGPEDYWRFMTTTGPAALVLTSLAEPPRRAIHDEFVRTLGGMFPRGRVQLSGEVLYAVGRKVS